MKKIFYFSITPDGTELAGIIEINGVMKNELYCDFRTDSRMALAKLVTALGQHIDRYNPNDKFFVAGYHLKIQLEHLKKLFRLHDHAYLGSYLNWRSVDIQSLGELLECYMGLRIESYDLAKLCAEYKVVLPGKDLLSEVRATRELIRKVVAIIFNIKE